MAQAFLHRQQSVAAGTGIDDAIRMQPDSGQAGGEQVRPLQHPQYRARLPGQDAGSESGRDGGVLQVRAGAHHFMQRIHCQAAAGQGGIKRRQAERERWPAGGTGATLDTGDDIAQPFHTKGSKG